MIQKVLHKLNAYVLTNCSFNRGRLKMLKPLSFLLFVGFVSLAHACPPQFICDSSGCQRVSVAACSQNTDSSQAVVAKSVTYGPEHSSFFTNQSAASVAAPQSSPSNQASAPKSGPGTQATASTQYTPSCAENGSCYGDISTINGMPKTTHVQGYYRKDGTYVRGHYRSSGRR